MSVINLFAFRPTLDSMNVIYSNGSNPLNNIILKKETLHIQLNNVFDGNISDTKRVYYAKKDGISGQGKFSVLSANEAMWQSPDYSGTFIITAYLENSDGISNIFTKEISIVDNEENYSGVKNCPSGFAYIPNSQNIEGSPFGWCVMKYEMTPYDSSAGWVLSSKNAWTYQNAYEIDATKNVTSAPNQLSINYVSGNNARAICTNRLVDQNGDYLEGGFPIKYNVWRVLIQDIASNPSNWSSGVVGSGYIYSGHSDNSPSTGIATSIDDNNSYYRTGNTSDNQRRTLFTSSGEALWDLAGNFWEQTYEGQNVGASTQFEYNNAQGNPFSPTTVIGSTASSWTSTNGIGRLYGNNTLTVDDLNVTPSYVLYLGGGWSDGSDSGIFTTVWDTYSYAGRYSDMTARCILPAH